MVGDKPGVFREQEAVQEVGWHGQGKEWRRPKRPGWQGFSHHEEDSVTAGKRGAPGDLREQGPG